MTMKLLLSTCLPRVCKLDLVDLFIGEMLQRTGLRPKVSRGHVGYSKRGSFQIGWDLNVTFMHVLLWSLL